jgi:Ca2+-binding RTX toxin-like protein
MVADSNNSISTARNLGTLPGNNGNVTDAFASDSINFSDDGSDFFRVQLADTSTLKFELTQGSSVRLALVRDANGNNRVDAGETIVSSTNSPFINGLAAGTYFLQATNQPRPISGTLPYTLGVRASSGIGIERVNESPREATVVEGNLNGRRIFRGELTSGGDTNDFYKVQIGAPTRFNAFLDRTDLNFLSPNVDMTLFRDANRDGNLTSNEVVARSSQLSNRDEALGVNLTTTGEYFLQVTRPQVIGNNDARAAYDLTLTGTLNSNFASSSVPQRLGTSGVDTIQGNNVGGIISAGRGDDLINAAGGNDIVLCGAGNDRANGGTGDDLIEGGIGKNQLKGAQGADTFVLNRNGTQTIQDFKDGIDRIGLSQGLVAEVLTFTQQGSDTVIQSGRASLAVLKNVQASAITGDDFVQISHARSGNLMLPIAVS